MDLTYKPYIRDSAFETLSIKTPSIVINGYKPKYTTDTKSEESEEASPVESPIEEIKTTQPSTVKHSSKTFKSKEEFKSTMLPIYESILIKKGLNPLFTKALVAQDGLESAWGSKLSGKYNFGGIKGKGTIKRTREVINGKDVYINDSFKDFNSLEDYANYKVNLLNSNRYKAFSGDISEFANRVHKGGYATDPNYANVLNRIILNVKHGGVLNFQEGGIIEGKKWVQNWYKNRKPLIKRNIQQNQKIPIPITKALGYNLLAKNMDLTRASVNPSKVPISAKGVYYLFGRKIYLKEDSTSSAIHEWTHSSSPDPQAKEIDKIKNLLGDAFYDQRSVIPDDYLDDSQEIYARLMQLRHALGVDPNHKFTNEEIEALKQDRIKQVTLTKRLKGKKNNSFSTTIFDKNGQIIYAEPFNPEYEYVPEESTSNVEYDETNSFNILNRYSTDAIRRLLNDVAQIPNKQSTINYAKSGLKIPKYQHPADKLMNNTTRQWMQNKNGEYAWAQRHNMPNPEFWSRLRDKNKESIIDWEDSNNTATHKLGYGEIDGKIIVYPEVQKVNGKLIDFTRPPYASNSGIINAYETGNYAVAPSAKIAENFTATYKQEYPGFQDHDIFKNKISRDVYHTKGDKINYVYNKLLASGYNKIQASAILGSLFIEGQLDENKKEVGGDGYGLMQWTDITRKNNLKNFKLPTAKNEFERQVDFLMQELKDPNVWLGQRHLDAFLNAKTIDNATEILAKRFCRPAKGKENMDNRKEVARFYVNQLPEYHLTKKYINLQ